MQKSPGYSYYLKSLRLNAHFWCDNVSATELAKNPIYHSRTKHIELDMHFVRDKVLARELEINYIPSEE